MPIGDTIVARATAPGQARRTLIRISGPHTEDALNCLKIDTPRRRGAFKARASVFGPHDLPMLVLRFMAPASYTGEDAAELLLPANDTLVNLLIDRLCSLDGVRRAEAGAFSSRAYLAGKLSLAQAEGVAAKIAAESASSLRAADRVLSGQAGDEHRAWADQLATLLALVEAGIDFTDQEDVVSIPSDRLRDGLCELIDLLDAAIGPVHTSWSSDRPLVALVGPPNAGKSTLFNALLGRDRVVTTPVAGTTRDVIVEPLDLSIANAPPVDLADLPGLDEHTTDVVDQDAQRHATAILERADLILLCQSTQHQDGTDRTAELSQETTESASSASEATVFADVPTHIAMLRICTKADRHLPSPLADLSVCARDGWHLNALRRHIAAHAFGSRRADESMLIPRHKAHTRSARTFLVSAVEELTNQPDAELLDAELIAGFLREALDHLGEVTGHIAPDAIIGRIFASFCVGK